MTTPISPRRKILVVIGTRPEAIKLAPLIRKLQEADWAEVEVLTTGQHRDLVRPMLDLFGIKASRELTLMQPGQSLNNLTASLLQALDDELTRSRPHLLLAQGDTTTVVASALAAYFLKVPFGHVEAGLRTRNLQHPFPEEGNRVVSSHLAALHFAPTDEARRNLLREGIDPKTIVVTGNTVIDALLQTVKLEAPIGSGIDLDPEARLILITAHRRDSFGEPIRQICEGIARLHDRHPDLEFLWPVHPNPNVGPVVHRLLGSLKRVHLVEPLEHAPFVSALRRAFLVLTDSGGVQEEAPALGKPVLVLREESERPEAIEAGLAKLIGTDASRLVREVETLLNDPSAYTAMAKGASPYGDGQASERIVQSIGLWFGLPLAG